MNNFFKTMLVGGAKYRALISIFLVNLLTEKGAILGLANLLAAINATNSTKEIRMQKYYYRSIRTEGGSSQIQLIDTSVTASDGTTNLNNGQLVDKDSAFAVGAISVRFATGGTAGNPRIDTYSNAVYDSAGAVRIPVGLQNADIEIKCGNNVVLERQSIKAFFAERNINVNPIGNYASDAVELTEPAFLVGGLPISAMIYLPTGATALAATAHVELVFHGVGTGNK